MSSLLAYCRSGYETDLAKELTEKAIALNCMGYPRFLPGQGYVKYICYNAADADTLGKKLAVSDTIFARQMFVVTDHLEQLDKADRLGPVLAAIKANDNPAMKNGILYVDHADTDDGKALAKLCRKFAVVLRQSLRKNHCLTYKEQPHGRAIHVFFTDFDTCQVGYSYPGCRSNHANGIYRLKFPTGAPSRSTLKLEEAILTMLTEQERDEVLRAGSRAVDLGACPGGWTYQLVRRGMYVEAIDNGEIDASLMASGQVEHFAADGFTYQPQMGRVELLVCDMIEQPNRVAKLMGDWLVHRLAEHAIFNLKLPMKKRFETVSEAIALLQERLDKLDHEFVTCFKHLYHNRDEITVTVVRKV
ncbi:23S rRNA (cytidine(2498)-2'-O)-methyltransferase RlmM [Salinimonas chungwhensis]|uniref:23S rRNA (cytidine(2498)-2'-O)-methyltransferase RlmM n=1 Tax=Salinimonas chungwhensis TaxID=265425 RepID=UPI000372746E|nr:23S rRNA (cytidine(2498)-2'-O)-methyltransferase RlmM [Salinimonas chungwhensis]